MSAPNTGTGSAVIVLKTPQISYTDYQILRTRIATFISNNLNLNLAVTGNYGEAG